MKMDAHLYYAEWNDRVNLQNAYISYICKTDLVTFLYWNEVSYSAIEIKLSR